MGLEHIMQNEMSDRERQVLNDIMSVYMWNLKKSNTKKQSKMPVTRAWGWGDKIDVI